ncbi:hypothetical protein [Actinacidiphila glaucinigra]|uniref:hypothetical protein n=1 Tax=Actinacidiphila glaucinigra TaxID=235986 RepID=UPI002E3230FF|nr:hypothetical protein [Actinacidiphila glaucinigra]
MANGTDTRTRGAEAGTARLSEHCELAKRPEYADLHRDCRRLEDHHMPAEPRIVLTPRCGCSCHGGAR